MPADATAKPVNPNSPAISATTRKTRAQPNIGLTPLMAVEHGRTRRRTQRTGVLLTKPDIRSAVPALPTAGVNPRANPGDQPSGRIDGRYALRGANEHRRMYIISEKSRVHEITSKSPQDCRDRLSQRSPIATPWCRLKILPG